MRCQTFRRAFVQSIALAAMSLFYVLNVGGQTAPELSIDDYSRLIESEPRNAENYGKRAELYLRSRQFVRAAEDASNALLLQPKFAAAYLTRAKSFCSLVKKREAVSDIERYNQISAKPTDYECWLSISDCIEDDYDCQIIVYTDKIKRIVKPVDLLFFDDSPYLYARRGTAYYKKGDYDNALSDFNRSIADFHRSYDLYLYRGDIYQRRGKYAEALADFEKALAMKPGSGEANAEIGAIYFRRNELPTALEYFNQAISLNSRLGKAYFLRGAIYLKSGADLEQTGNADDASKAAENYRRAVKDFDSVIEIELNNAPPETYLRRGKALEKLGETEKATKDREKYRELSEQP